MPVDVSEIHPPVEINCVVAEPGAVVSRGRYYARTGSMGPVTSSSATSCVKSSPWRRSDTTPSQSTKSRTRHPGLRKGRLRRKTIRGDEKVVSQEGIEP